MEEFCALEESWWTPSPPGAPLPWEELQLLLNFVCSTDATQATTSSITSSAAPEAAASAVSAGGEQISEPPNTKGPPEQVTKLLNLLIENALAAATAAATNTPGPLEYTSNGESFDEEWVRSLWIAHFRQYLERTYRALASRCFAAGSGFACDLHIVQQLEDQQAFVACLVQAAESLTKHRKTDNAAPAAALSLAAAAPAPATAATTATRQQRMISPEGEKERNGGGLLTPHAVAVASMYAKLSCLWLNQLMQQQLLLLLEHRQPSGMEGKLQRIFRMLQRVLIILSPFTADTNSNGNKGTDIGDSNTSICSSSDSKGGHKKTATCSSALVCTCWRASPQRSTQEPSDEQQQVTPASSVALCFARRFLRGLSSAILRGVPKDFSTPCASALPAAPVPTPQNRVDLLRLFSAFTATETPRDALLDSIRQQAHKQHQMLLQLDVWLLEEPMRLCVITLLHSLPGSSPAAAAAAEGLSWGISSLGPHFWSLPCLQHLLFGYPVQHVPAQKQQQQPHQQGQYKIFSRLLELLQQEEDVSAMTPMASLFVQLLLDSYFWTEGPHEASGQPTELPHCCRVLLIRPVLILLTEQGKESREAALHLLQLVQPASTAAVVAAEAEPLWKAFFRLRPLAKTALLRSLLLLQHEPGVRGNSNVSDQKKQAGGKQSACCCAHTSLEEQEELLELQLRCIAAVTEAKQELDEDCRLLLLQLWLQQAPQAPLLQLLKQQQQHTLEFVAGEALTSWPHHRRSVQAAARSVWALLQQRCSDGVAAAPGSTTSSSNNSGRTSNSDLLVTLCKRVFCLPTACRKTLYQALSSLVHALGAARVLQVQPYLLEHLLSQLYNRSLRSAAMLALRALCEDLSKEDRQRQQQQKQKQKGNDSSHCTQHGRMEQRSYAPSPSLRKFLMKPLQNALTASRRDSCCNQIGLQQRQQQEEQQQQGPRDYPFLLPVYLPGAADASPGEALDETMLPLLLRLDPSAAAPLLLCLRERLPLEVVEAVAEKSISDATAGAEAHMSAPVAGTTTATATTTAATQAAAGTHLNGVALACNQASFDGLGRPWSPSEAALLAAARAVGLATWENARWLQNTSSSCCRKPRNTVCSDSNSSCCSFRGCRICGCKDYCSATDALVVRGCSSTAAPVCYRVSAERLRQGLISGHRRQRMRLLEALTLHAQSTAAPTCQELQLLLFVAGQQLRLGSASERSQFVAAFDRVLLRARNAFRLRLVAIADATIEALARSGCCCCRPQQQQESDTLPSRCFPLQKQDQQQQQEHGLACGGAFGCFLLFLQRLHRRCLLSCYPGAPPDRVLVCLSLLRSLHFLWGRGVFPEQHRKRSTALQAAAALSNNPSSTNSNSPNTNTGCNQQWALEAVPTAVGCGIGAALGWESTTVRQQLLAMLPVVNGPAPRGLLLDLLQLLPPDGYSLAAVIPQAQQTHQQQKHIQTCRQQRKAQRQQQNVQMHLRAPHGMEPRKQEQAEDPHQKLQHFLVLNLMEDTRRRVYGAVEMAVSLRQDYCAAGTLYLQLMLQQVFMGPAEAAAATAAISNGCQLSAASAAFPPGGPPCELPASVLQRQTVFCVALEESLRRILPPALQATAAEVVPPLLPRSCSTGSSNGRSNTSINKSCMSYVCGGLLRVLCILTTAVEVRVAAVLKSPLALAEPQMGLHGILGVLEVCLATIKPSLLQVTCSNSSRPSNCGCKEAMTAWRDWQQRVLLLLLSICRCLTSVVAAGDEEDTPQLALPNADTESPTAASATDAVATTTSDVNEPKRLLEETVNDQVPLAANLANSSTGQPQSQQTQQQLQPEHHRQKQLQVDCRGHLVVCQYNGEDTETQQQLLAFCSWRAVKGATECLMAFCKLARFEQSPGVATAKEAATAAINAGATAAVKLGHSGFEDGFREGHGTEDVEVVALEEQKQQQQQQPFLLLSVDEVAALGSDLVEFLLACRHMGALEFLHDALAALCIKINASKVPSLQRLIRQWADEVLLLLLPHARATGMEPHQQQHPATILLRAFRMPLNVRRGTIGPPPPVRKSKSLGDGAKGEHLDFGLLLHVVSCLLPLAAGRLRPFFAAAPDALGAQVHALNLLRSFVTSSPEVAACDVLSAAAAADGAVRYSWRCNIGDYSSIDDSSTGDNSNNNSSTTRCPQPTGATGILFEGRTAQSVSPSICLTAGARDVEIFKVSAHPGSSSPMTLSAAALAISIQTISSTDFPVRSAASSLQVATTKRLAGTDDETQRASVNAFEFCSGAALRSSSGAGCGLLSIGFSCFAAPLLRPHLARALIPLVSTVTHHTMRENDGDQPKLSYSHHHGREQQPQQQELYRRLVVPHSAALLVRGLADYGPPDVASLINNLPVGFPPSTERAQLEQQQQHQQDAAVAVLLLLTRTDFSSIAASDLPALETLLENSPPNTILAQLDEVAAAGTGGGSFICKGGGCTGKGSKDARVLEGCAAAPATIGQHLVARTLVGANREATKDGEATAWLLLMLRALCCCLAAVSFASRALAARALASYVLQRTRMWGAGSLLEALTVAVAVAVTPCESASFPGSHAVEAGRPEYSSPAPRGTDNPDAPAAAAGRKQRRVDANGRSGLLLLALELLSRPETAGLVEEGLAAEKGAELTQKLQEMSWQLQQAAAGGPCQRNAVERVLVLQVLRAVALVVPERYEVELWGRVAAASTAALGLPSIQSEVDAGRLATMATAAPESRGPNFTFHVGLPALQAVSLRLLVERHLRSRQPAAGRAAVTHLRALRDVAGILSEAIALSVHVQALESALLAVADLTRAQCNFKYESLEFAQGLNENFTCRYASSDYSHENLEQNAAIDALPPVEETAAGLTTLWKLCWSLLADHHGIGARVGITSTKAVSVVEDPAGLLWGLPYGAAPLRVAACEALAAIASFAAAHPRLCQNSCVLHPQEAAAAAAAAAAPAAAAAVTSNGAANAWTRLGAALLRCLATAVASSSSSSKGTRCSSSSNNNNNNEMRSTFICFETPQNQWASLWASAMLRCAQPTQEVAVRLRTAEVSKRPPMYCTIESLPQALSISGLPLPCPEGLGSGSGCGCSWAKLRAWRALLLLLQDEDVTVRDEATAAASAAAAGLLYRLPSAAERPPAAGQPAAAEAYGEGNDHNEELRVLLTAAATPILSDEPHGLEAGSLFQLLLQILSRIFPEREVCRLLWRQLRRGGSINRSSRRSSHNDALMEFREKAGPRPEQQQQEKMVPAATERVFEEVPMNMYGDPLLSMQVAARLLVMVMLQQQQQEQRRQLQGTSQIGSLATVEPDTTAQMKTSGGTETKRDRAQETNIGGALAAVRRAVVRTSVAAIHSKGAAVAALQDLSGGAQTRCWRSGSNSNSNSSWNALLAPATSTLTAATTAPAAAAVLATQESPVTASAAAPPTAKTAAATTVPTPMPEATLKSSRTSAKTVWLRRAIKAAAADMQALQEMLSSAEQGAVTEAQPGYRVATAGSTADTHWLLHPTQQQLYLQAQQVLLSAWVSVVLWLDYGFSLDDTNVRRLSTATETLVMQFAAATAAGQHPHPLVVAATQGLHDILYCAAAATAANAAAPDAAAAHGAVTDTVKNCGDVDKEISAVAPAQSREEVNAFIEIAHNKGDTALAARSAQAAGLLAGCCLSLLPDSFMLSC
ncbi:hypothetical protein, conserved [Eimeria maxima]|uniref:DUF2428 domain-containing protein n=1 Tax=Eimeria maxima TaxID=5804 RepID=U6MHT3_EIMMA|nr:hypothetical protein, conserved [Eimeria maxima]CDJ61210.1 hypothetical protein, conserved [Eimeria maxima]